MASIRIFSQSGSELDVGEAEKPMLVSWDNRRASSALRWAVLKLYSKRLDVEASSHISTSNESQ